MTEPIVERWNATGLNISIKDLWPGCPKGPEDLVQPGASGLKGDGGPDNERLPRARYISLDHEMLEMTASSKVFKVPFFIFLYSKSMADLNTYSEAVIQAFENSHLASADPFSIDEGCVIHLDWVARQNNVMYGEVKFSELQFEYIYVRPRVMPS
jgi:hypothetical protein